MVFIPQERKWYYAPARTVFPAGKHGKPAILRQFGDIQKLQELVVVVQFGNDCVTIFTAGILAGERKGL